MEKIERNNSIQIQKVFSISEKLKLKLAYNSISGSN
jgi:hypothetical protein